jgi:hypothetical protein
MTCTRNNTPGSKCCGPSGCELLPVDPALPDAAFASLAAVQAAFSLRAGSWTDVDGIGTELELQAAGVQLLVDTGFLIPNYSPFGVMFTVYFKGRDGSVIRFYAGADADVSLSAEVTLGADCGEVRFYEQALTGETRIGDVHVIRELRGEEWHRITVCYDPTRGYLTATITTLAEPGHPWAYSVQITSTGQAGYGLGTVTDTAEFKTFTSTATEHYLARDPADSCGDVVISTTVEGYDGKSAILTTSTDPDPVVGFPYTLNFTGTNPDGSPAAGGILIEATTTAADIEATFLASFGLRVTAVAGGVWSVVIATPNEQQTATITSNPQAGTWSLTFDGQTTTDLAWDCDAAAVEATLEALSTIGSGNVTVTGTSPAFTVEFVGTLAATDVPAMTATHTFTACDCPYDGYTYGGECLKHCPTCDPSCALAGSPFSAQLSACDWDGAGYTFGDGTATGTGTLTHRTEIYGTDYIVTLSISQKTTEMQDGSATYYLRFPCGGDAATYHVENQTVGGVVQYRWTITCGADHLYTAWTATPPTSLSLRICHHATDTYIASDGITLVHHTCGAVAGGNIQAEIDGADGIITELNAVRHKADMIACDPCVHNSPCWPEGALDPPDTVFVDLSDWVPSVLNAQCPLCGAICTSFPSVWPVIQWPAFSTTNECSWFAVIGSCYCDCNVPHTHHIVGTIHVHLAYDVGTQTGRWYVEVSVGGIDVDPGDQGGNGVPGISATMESDDIPYADLLTFPIATHDSPTFSRSNRLCGGIGGVTLV